VPSREILWSAGVSRVDLKEHVAACCGGHRFQRFDAARKPLARDRLDEPDMVAILRFDRDDLAAIAYPFRKAQREKPDIGADIDHQRPGRHKFPQPVDRPGLDILFVDRIKRDKGPIKQRQALQAELRGKPEQLDRGISDEDCKHSGIALWLTASDFKPQWFFSTSDFGLRNVRFSRYQ
jgi:hypothetical protein